MDNKQEQTLAEKMGMTYTEGPDGLLYPDVELGIPEKENRPLGKYGRARKTFLQEHRTIQYESLLIDCLLMKQLHQVEDEAKEMLETLMAQLQKQYPAPDRATQPVEWAGYMNNLKAKAEEVIYQELIYK